jgi:hypothetical protein
LAFRAAASGVPCASIAVWEPPYILPSSRPPVPDDYADRQAELAQKGDTGAMAELFLVTAVGMPCSDGDRDAAGPVLEIHGSGRLAGTRL